MIAEIIAIGDELSSGRVLNTTSALAAKGLTALGHEIRMLHTLGDKPDLIAATLQRSLEYADCVIVSGGLGPTTDDLTNAAVAQAFNLKLTPHPPLEAAIRQRMAQEAGLKTLDAAKLALLPEGAKPLDASQRMAGYLLHQQGKPLWFLPGIPSQMEILLNEMVFPELRRRFPVSHTAQERLYRCCGIREAAINTLLRPLELWPHLQLGYYPLGCEVHVHLRVLDSDNNLTRLHQAETFIREQLGPNLYGMGDETLALATARLCSQHAIRLATAESCTGGLIAAALTEIPGSSAWYAGGLIVYSNALKELLLGLDPSLLEHYGAVSAECIGAMASQTALKLGCDCALAVSGIAGPSGGSAEKPVGTVYIGLSSFNQVEAHRFQFHGARRDIQHKTMQMALDLLRRNLSQGQKAPEGDTSWQN